MKWELPGSVVDVLGNNQYAIKMDGSEKISLRNTQFYKRIMPSSSMMGSIGGGNSFWWSPNI